MKSATAPDPLLQKVSESALLVMEEGVFRESRRPVSSQSKWFQIVPLAGEMGALSATPAELAVERADLEEPNKSHLPFLLEFHLALG